MKRSLSAATVGLLVLFLIPTAPAGAQIPDEFTNLQLLPEDIDKRQLIGVMRGWAGGLGVRCNHCHVGPDNLQGMDFASDEKATKRAAREMLQMSRVINGTHIKSLEGEEKRQVVSCYTCHRGQSKPPRRTHHVLGEVAMESGVEAAMTRYEELKSEYYGQGVYEFGPRTVSRLAQAAFEAGQLPAAVEVLERGLEIYPDEADLHAFLGMARMQGGDAAAAEASFQKALELDPENASAQRGQMMLEQSRAEPESGSEGDER